MQTNLKNVVVLESLFEGDPLGDSECISEVFVGELVHLDCVVWFDRIEVGWVGDREMTEEDDLRLGMTRAWPSVSGGRARNAYLR